MNGQAAGGGDEFDLLGYDGVVPADMTSFVGREAEIQAARNLLLHEGKRLVTLRGIGGVGKSRLLEHLAGDLHDAKAYPDGITMVRLAHVPPSAEAVASTIAHRVLGADHEPESALARLITHFEHKRALLLLDNCEQLAGDGPLPRLLNLLLHSARQLYVVTTSQVRLGSVGEWEVTVPPLGVDDALEIFVDRAAALGEPIAPEEYPLVRRLCEATDGIPLAVELAAGQLDVLTLHKLVDRAKAENLLPVLVDGTSEQRHHRTMADSISRSYELLNATERQVFALLSVFRGGFDLDAAVAVVARFDIDTADIERAIPRLIRRSLLVAANLDGRKRCKMVEVLREFAQQRLQADKVDVARLDQAHANHFLEASARARRSWFGPREPIVMRSVALDRPNIRSAQQSLLDRPDTAPLGLILALNTAATRALVFDGRLQEILQMLEAGLAQHPPEPSQSQIAALSITLWVAVMKGQRALADSLLNQIEKAATQLDCWETSGSVLYARGTLLGLTAPDATHARSAIDLLARAETALQREGNPGEAFMPASFQGIVAAFDLDKDTAFTVNRRVLATAQAAQSPLCIAWGLWGLAVAELMHGDDAAAATRLAQEALTILLEIGDRWGRIWALWLLALCALKDGNIERGAVLLGGADREQATTQANVAGMRTFLRVQQQIVSIARKKLGDGLFEDLVAAGHAMKSAKSFKLALSDEPIDLVTLNLSTKNLSQAGPLHSVLSDREREVADLVAEGKTNGEIAAKLVLSERTIEQHIRHINTKLHTRNRSEITAYVLRHRLVRPTS
ncbi:Uncharacterised protein [Amycolatopsis camponoti]|uniref:HTH luxR-type domain-containing protein n=1 Tax=Amycolatopsis camponoti TaxID=2606593 RepID=A0A6I8M519_9PSEU|nr:LuxR C-terminal-related transcriptional regulator [Amycolatopsis camponoti]VVJ22733.1 Uncharacterised protein [Amycolatopsis camponoti]